MTTENTEESIIIKSHYFGGGGVSGNDCLVMFLDCLVSILFSRGYFKIF